MFPHNRGAHANRTAQAAEEVRDDRGFPLEPNLARILLAEAVSKATGANIDLNVTRSNGEARFEASLAGAIMEIRYSFADDVVSPHDRFRGEVTLRKSEYPDSATTISAFHGKESCENWKELVDAVIKAVEKYSGPDMQSLDQVSMTGSRHSI